MTLTNPLGLIHHTDAISKCVGITGVVFFAWANDENIENLSNRARKMHQKWRVAARFRIQNLAISKIIAISAIAISAKIIVAAICLVMINCPFL